jgi:hypothetical protein
MGALNDQNKDQVRELVKHGLKVRDVIEHARGELAHLRAAVERYEETLRVAERERERNNRGLKELGFHDVGHARTEFHQQGETDI